MKIFLDTASLTEIREGAALTDIGLKRFLEDWEEAKKEIAAKTAS